MAGASITVERSFGSLADLNLLPTAEEMRELGLLQRERIIRRTRQGLDADGQPFARYSAGYEKQKAAALGTASPVDLTVSGNMLNQITIVDVDAGDEKASVTLGWNQ